MLIIPQNEFTEFYPTIDYINIFYSKPNDSADLITNYLPSKLWRLNNLYTIVNKAGTKQVFNMNRAQHMVYARSLEHPRLIILKSRQQGISTLWLISFFDDLLFKPNYTLGLMAQGKEEAATLLLRLKLAWDELDPDIKAFLNIEVSTDNTTSFGLTNGSTILVRISFRSTTLQRVHISEFGKIANKYPEKAKEVDTGTLQAIAPGNTAIIESTAEGENRFKTKWDNATTLVESGQQLTAKDFSPIFLSWLDDPDCVESVEQQISIIALEYFKELEGLTNRTLTKYQKWFWVSQYRELGDDIFQEYPATPEEAFLKSRDGAYYAVLYKSFVIKHKRIVPNLYDPNLPVFCSLDLGMDDSTVLCFFQYHQKQYRIIDEYKNNGEAISHYVDIMADRDYTIERVFLPHDVMVRELGTGKTRLSKFQELGVTNCTVLAKSGLMDGIDAVREILKMLWIDSKCHYLQKCFLNYTKEWDDKGGVWKDTPARNIYTHGADAMREMVLSKVEHYKVSQNDNNAVVDGISL